MKLSSDQVRVMSNAIQLDIPEADLKSITVRLATVLTAMEDIERELGAAMDKTEPIPPVIPHESQ